MHGQNVFIELKLVCRLYGMNSLSLSMISFYIELRKFNKSITTNEQMIKTKNKNTIIAINCNDKTIHIKSVHTHSHDIRSTQIPDGNDKNMRLCRRLLTMVSFIWLQLKAMLWSLTLAFPILSVNCCFQKESNEQKI